MKRIKLHVPTEVENAEIQRGIDADPDTYELAQAEFARLERLGRRGPQKLPTKVPVTIRLSPDVVNKFKASGDGWQTRIDSALRDWLKTHEPA